MAPKVNNQLFLVNNQLFIQPTPFVVPVCATKMRFARNKAVEILLACAMMASSGLTACAKVLHFYFLILEQFIDIFNQPLRIRKVFRHY